jgi:hypothetical protein
LGIDVTSGDLPAGSIIQVQSTHIPNTSVLSTTSTGWVSTGYGVAITPKFASSKLLVVLHYQIGTSDSNPYVGIGRDNVIVGGGLGFAKSQTDYSWPNYTDNGSVSYTFDAGSTATTAFHIMLANQVGGTTYLGRSGAGYGVGSSSITVYEIAQ